MVVVAHSLDFSRLQTPPSHGDVLIEPPISAWREISAENRSRLSSSGIVLLGQPLGKWRATLHGKLGLDSSRPILAVGHQPEFFHAGVWAKNVVASDMASVSGGDAVNLIVDSDAPSGILLDIPRIAGDEVTVAGVPFAPWLAGVAFESMEVLRDERLDAFADAVRRAMGEACDASMMGDFLDGLRVNQDADDWVDQLTAARRAVERSFNVTVRDVRISRYWPGPLLIEMLLNAQRFGDCYNAALAGYRTANRVRGANRPIPDLARSDGRFEVPAWVYRPGEPRRRLFVARHGDRLHLFADDDPIGEWPVSALETWQKARAMIEHCNGFVFRPRALALTIWARLLLADVFIHGIGGAKYDRITDEIIRRYFGVEPPEMACVSATLRVLADGRLPHASFDAAAQRLRDLRYNPQRYIHGSADAERLIAQKGAAVAEAAELKKRRDPDHRRRRALFDRIHRLNASILETDPTAHDRLGREIDRARSRSEARRRGARRDYFFALLPRESVTTLRHALARQTGYRL